jgi:coproporphyrinogen III oxidase-like Fe-S oxidoreductase
MQLQPMEGFSPEPEPRRQYLLYIHIPFCESLCPFCSFHRVRFDDQRARRYFEALRKEIQTYYDAGFVFSDIYVGGGTPTVLPEELTKTLDMLGELYDINSISVETNPNHLTQPILDELKMAGVTRLSVGVQSLDDDLLREMGRFEPYGSAQEIIERLRLAQGQFDTFNVDMIFNIPHQSRVSLKNDLDTLMELGIDQISYYPLMPSETTERAMDRKMGHLDFKHERAYYEFIRESLTPEYQTNSAWCFSQQSSSIDEYIVDHDEYVGIGSGAFSYLNQATYSTTFSLNHYVDLVERGIPAITSGRKMTTKEQAQYDFLMRLFGMRLDRQAMMKKYGPGCRRLLWKELLIFKLIGAIRETPDEFLVTQPGTYLWVVMMREFFIGVNNFRTQMRARVHDEWEVLSHKEMP